MGLFSALVSKSRVSLKRLVTDRSLGLGGYLQCIDGVALTLYFSRPLRVIQCTLQEKLTVVVKYTVKVHGPLFNFVLGRMYEFMHNLPIIKHLWDSKILIFS